MAIEPLHTFPEAFVPYITHIRTSELRGIPPLDVPPEPAEGQSFRHLVLTGPNGTGKTSILALIASQAFAGLRLGDAARPIPTSKGTLTDAQVRRHANLIRQTAAAEIGPGESNHADGLPDGYADLSWSPPLPSLGAVRTGKHSTFCYLPARRAIEINPVESITSEHSGSRSPFTSATPQFLQFLVNQKAQQSFARDDDDATTTERIETWFLHIERGLGRLLGDDDLQLEFDRKALTFFLSFGGQRRNLLELAHGHAAAVGVIAEIIMRIETSDYTDGFADSGIVLLDEPEMHLHLELQERILPALVKTFPHIQLIVATHSPVVVSSIEDAIVFDLEDRKPRHSEDLRGRPYGWIMKRHFGLEEDFDLATTELLDPCAGGVEKHLNQRLDQDDLPWFSSNDPTDMVACNTADELMHLHRGTTDAADDLRATIKHQWTNVLKLICQLQALQLDDRGDSDEALELVYELRCKVSRDAPYSALVRGTLQKLNPRLLLSLR